MKIIYKPELLLTERGFIRNSGVFVSDGIISEINDFHLLKYKYTDAKIINWDKLVMIPGTVNAHNHSFQSILRSIADDKPFLVWRDLALYKYSPYLSDDDIYKCALFAFTEMMKYGVTTVCDFFYLHNNGITSDEAIIKAAKDTGIRLVLARAMYDWNGAPKGYQETVDQAVKNTKYLAIKYQGDAMITISPAPHSLHGASIDMIKAGYNLAKELDTHFHIHVAEEMFEVNDILKKYRLRPIQLLNKFGILDERMVAIHAVWLSKDELQLLEKNKVNLAYCPSSNMFLADGITDIPELLKNNMTIGLGTDGACSNNRISVFEEMRMTSLLQKINKLDTTIIDSKQVFKMGTEQGGKVLGLPIGKIKPGYMADFVGIDLEDLSLQPIFSPNSSIINNIVYSMQPNAISRVVIDGKESIVNKKIINISEKKVLDNVMELVEKLNKINA